MSPDVETARRFAEAAAVQLRMAIQEQDHANPRGAAAAVEEAIEDLRYALDALGEPPPPRLARRP